MRITPILLSLVLFTVLGCSSNSDKPTDPVDLNPTTAFDSQETLIAYLDGASYQSVDMRNIGLSADGSVSLGYWYVDFTDNTFNWTYTDIAEAGTYSFVDVENFTAVFSDREFNVAVEQDEIVWDNLRYRRLPVQ